MDAGGAPAKRPQLVGASHRQTAVEEAGQAIALLHQRGEEIRAAELAQANGKLGALSPAERRAIETVTVQVVNTLLHVPTARMEEAAARADGARYAAVLRHLFALEGVA